VLLCDGKTPDSRAGGKTQHPRNLLQVWPTCLITLCLALLCSSAASIAANDPSPNPSASITPTMAPMSPVDLARSRIDTMLRTGHADSTWFSATFLAQIPASKVDEVITGLKSTLGEYKLVEFTPAKFVAHFAKGTEDVIIHLDADDKIDGLLFRPPALAASSLEDSLRALRPRSGTLSSSSPKRAAPNERPSMRPNLWP